MTCPKCNKVTKIKLEQVSKGELITCPKCNNHIRLVDKDDSTKKGIKDINKSFSDLEKAIKKLGK